MAGAMCVVRGAMCGMGVCMAGGVHVCMAGGCVWLGVCMAGGMHGGEACMAEGVCGRKNGNCSRRYASDSCFD